MRVLVLVWGGGDGGDADADGDDDAIVIKVRDGQVANRPFYAAIGVSLDGERDTLAAVGRLWG